MEFLEALGGWGHWFLTYLLPFLFVLTVVVFFHELGHFLVARWCGVHVRVFSIGFGREIFGFNDRKGTRWRLAWIPLGGYVKFLDDENAASVPDSKAREAMSEAERKGSFHAKPLWQRAAVVAAGPFANFLLAIVILAGLFAFIGQHLRIARIDYVQPGSPAAAAGLKAGDIVRSINGREISGFNELRLMERTSTGSPLRIVVERDGRLIEVTATPEPREIDTPYGGRVTAGALGIEITLRPRIGGVLPGGAAAEAGLKPGDEVVSIDGRPVTRFRDLQEIVRVSAGKPLLFKLRRDGQVIERTVVPKARKAPGKGEGMPIGFVGIQAWSDPADWTYKRYGPIQALWKGTEQTWFILTQSVSYVGRLFTGAESTEQLGGPIRIAMISGEEAKAGLLKLLNFTALISISIGFINLFPIPLLDGGHLLFYAIEAFRGQPLSERVQEIGFRIGLALVLMLMIFATWNDLIYLLARSKS